MAASRTGSEEGLGVLKTVLRKVGLLFGLCVYNKQNYGQELLQCKQCWCQTRNYKQFHIEGQALVVRRRALRHYAPRQYAPRQYAPRQYALRHYAPRQYASRQFVPETVCPEAICPDTICPEKICPETIRPKLGSCYNPNLLFPGRMTQGLGSITVHLTPRWDCVTT